MRAAGGSWGQSWEHWGQQWALFVQRSQQVSCRAVPSAVLSQLGTHPLASAPCHCSPLRQ